jgi:hypothetical protein
MDKVSCHKEMKFEMEQQYQLKGHQPELSIAAMACILMKKFFSDMIDNLKIPLSAVTLREITSQQEW